MDEVEWFVAPGVFDVVDLSKLEFVLERIGGRNTSNSRFGGILMGLVRRSWIVNERLTSLVE